MSNDFFSLIMGLIFNVEIRKYSTINRNTIRYNYSQNYFYIKLFCDKFVNSFILVNLLQTHLR